MFTNLLHRKNSKTRAQAMIEFAIVLPILMLLLIGIFEVGRLVIIFSAVTNASREAVRFGSALGFDDQGLHKYRHCWGIRDMAARSAFFIPADIMNIQITYDHGPGTATFATCSNFTSNQEDTHVVVSSGDRVNVTVTYLYTPLTKLMPFGQRTITSQSARTILGNVDIGTGYGGGSIPGGGGGGGGSLTGTPTVTATATETETPTATPTVTETPGLVVTGTPIPSPTITLLPSGSETPTETPVDTPTATETPTPTDTPTPTATTLATCDQITTSDMVMSSSSPYITMQITNPYTDVTVSSVRLIWNASSGGPGNQSLTWKNVGFGSIFWAVGNGSGDFTSVPDLPATIPGYNAITTLTIEFDSDYQNPANTGTTIIINLSTPGCNPITRTQ